MRSTFISILVVLAIVAGYPLELTKGAERGHEDRWIDIPVARGGQPIVVPVTLAGTPFQFVMAAESSNHMFDATLGPLLDEPIGTMHIKAFDSAFARASIVRTPLLYVNHQVIKPRAEDVSGVLDLSSIRHICEQDIRGILGPEFLRGRLVMFDFDAGLVRLSQGGVDQRNLGTAVPLRIDQSGRVIVDNVRIGESSECFQIHTASNFAVQVHDWLFESLRANGQLKVIRETEMSTPAGAQKQALGLLSEISWGAFARRDILVTKGHHNALGLKYLSRFVMTIDASGGKVYLLPGKHSERPDSVDVAGFRTEKREGVIVVTVVREHSPAREADVRVDDSVRSINGISCRDMRHLEFLWQIEESKGARLTLTLDRKGTPITADFDVPLTMSPDLFSAGQDMRNP